jgi:hypothetical protein
MGKRFDDDEVDKQSVAKIESFFFLEIDVIAFKQFPLVGTSFKFYIWQLSEITRLYAIFFKGIPLIPSINDNITERLWITFFTRFAIYIYET